MTIGEFAARSRLSPKALRLYDRLGVLSPARVDPATGYRIYCETQIAEARTIALLRRIEMPLATISEVITADSRTAAAIVADYWSGVSTRNAERSALVAYLQARLTGATTTMHQSMYELQTRAIASRDVLSINRHVHLADTDAFFADAFAQLRATGPGLSGIEGAPYLIFYGEVSDDSDGPLELCRPVQSRAATATDDYVQSRTEPAHDEVYIRLSKREMGWPTMLPAIEALEAWIAEHARQPAGPVRQVLIGDQRTAAADTPVCDLTIPLRPNAPTTAASAR